jgi:hypothetical protein
MGENRAIRGSFTRAGCWRGGVGRIGAHLYDVLHPVAAEFLEGGECARDCREVAQALGEDGRVLDGE